MPAEKAEYQIFHTESSFQNQAMIPQIDLFSKTLLRAYILIIKRITGNSNMVVNTYFTSLFTRS